MKKKIETTLYSFDELSEKSKENALQPILERIREVAGVACYCNIPAIVGWRKIREIVNNVEKDYFYRDGSKYDEKFEE